MTAHSEHTGCNGKNGGGMNHYVGQEKLAPVDSWAAIMSSKDHGTVARLQQAPIWHYINSCQWRYDGCQKGNYKRIVVLVATTKKHIKFARQRQ